MPNIRVYENKQEGPQPTDRGSSAFSMEGRRVGAFYHQIGQDTGGTLASLGDQYVAHQTRVETAQLGADLATAHADLATQWNALVAKTDPKDVEKAAEDFREKVAKPTLSKIGEGLETEGAQDMFTRASASVADEIFQKTAADSARLTAAGAVSNVLTMGTQLTNTVFSDPTSYGTSRDLLTSVMDGMVKTGGLPSEDRIKVEEKLQHDLAKSAALGMLQKNPTQGKADIADGRFDKYLKGEEIAELQAHGTELEHAADTARKANDVEARRAQKDAADAYWNPWQAKMLQPDGTLKVPPGAAQAAVNYSTMPGVTPAEGRSAIDLIKKVTDDQSKNINRKSDPATYTDVKDRIFHPEKYPNQAPVTQTNIDELRANGLLGDKDYSVLTHSLKDKDNPQQKQIHAFLGDAHWAFFHQDSLSLTGPDPNTSMRFYDFSTAATAMINMKIQNGSSVDAAIDDVRRSMLPRYLRGAQNVQPGAAPAVKPEDKIKPGESIADYAKRIGGH